MQEDSSSLYRGEVEVWGGRSTADMLSEFKKKGRRMIGGNGNSANYSRMRNQRVMLLLALAAAVLGVMLLHKLREGRIYGLLLQDRDRQVVGLQLVLQREREKTREMKRNLEDKRAKISILKIQKMELANKLSESKEMVDHLHRTQEEMEATLTEKQNQINMLSAKTQESTMTTSLHVAALTETVKQKEAEVEEMKQRLMKQTPTPMENNPTAQDEGMEKLPNSEDPKNQKPINSQDQNENSEEVHEVIQVSTSEIKEQSEDEVSQVSTTEIQEQKEKDSRESELQASDGNMSEKLDSSQDSSNEKQVVPEETKMAGDGEETRTRHGRRNKRRTRRRKKPTSRGRDLERKSEKNEQDGELNGTVTTTTTTTVPDETPVDEGSKMESQSNSEGNTNQEGAESVKESQGDIDEQNETVPNPTVPDETPVDEGLKTEDQTNSEGKPEGTTEERLDDSYQQQASDTRNQEGAGSATESDTAVPNDTPLEEVTKTEGQGDSEGNTEGATEERRDDSNQQQPDTRNQEGDGENRIIREEDGKEVVTSTQGKSEESENLVDDAKNNSSDEKVVDTADFIQDKESGAEKQDEVIKEEEEEEEAKPTSNIKQAEVQNNGNDRQSQISENIIDTTGESNVGELKEEEGVELTDNAENQDSKGAA